MNLFYPVFYRTLCLLGLFLSQVNYAKHMSFIKYCEAPQDMTAADLFTLKVLKEKFDESKCDALESKLKSSKILWLTGLEIESVNFLKYFRHIERLDLSDNHIRNIDSLAGLQGLTHLWLAENEIDDISVLRWLNALELLVLSENRIKRIDSLTNCFNLKALNLSGNWIADLSPLKMHKDLRFIFLSNNMIEDLSPVAHDPDADKISKWRKQSAIHKQEVINWKNLTMEMLLPHEAFRILDLGNNPLGRPAWHDGVVKNSKNCPPDASFQVIRKLCRF